MTFILILLKLQMKLELTVQNMESRSFMTNWDMIVFNGKLNSDGVFSSDNFNQAMEFKSQGYTGDSQSQFSSYVISFTTQHTDSHEVELTTGSGNQQFSGIAANIYSFQNAYYSMMSSLYGEQRALDPAGALVEAKKIIPHWG